MKLAAALVAVFVAFKVGKEVAYAELREVVGLDEPDCVHEQRAHATMQ